MGYNILFWGIDTNKIKAVFGSKDKELLKFIQKDEAFDDYEAFLHDFLQEHGKLKTNAKKALEDIIMKRAYDKKSYFAYGYALFCICNSLGKHLPGTQIIIFGNESNLIDKILLEDFGIENLKVNHNFIFQDEDNNPFDIPPIADWPVINLLTRERLIELDKILKEVIIKEDEIKALSKKDKEKANAYEKLKGIIENIKYCIENNMEMINICP